MSLSRRSFLKGGLVGSAAAVAVSSNVASAEELLADVKIIIRKRLNVKLINISVLNKFYFIQ